ncbi:MAG: DMT family transporter [Pseudomonadota bacterium]
MNSDTKMLAYALLVFTTMCWGANAVFGRVAVGEISPLLLTVLRWAGAVMIMGLVGYRLIRRDFPTLWKHRRYVFVMGAGGFAIFNALMYVAAHTTTAVNIGIIQGAMPAMVLLGVFLAYRTRIRLLQIVGVIVTLIGVVIVASGGSIDQLLQLAFKKGDVFMLIASLFYASYAVALRNKPPVAGQSLFFAMALCAFIVATPMAAYEMVQSNFTWPTTKGWTVALAITIFPSVLAQLCFIRGVGLIGPGRAGVFVNLIPIFASLFAIAFLNESFHLYHALALALVLTGIGLSEYAGRSDQVDV